MELRIRSQDRKSLIKCNYDILIGKYNPRELTVVTDKNLYEKLPFKIWINNMSVGSYKTEERALEVLDEIQRTITKQLVNRHKQLDGNYSFEVIDTAIYEMPKE